MTTPPPVWQSWFPPGLDPDVAAGIADLWWKIDPHWAAYLAWSAYAATLPPGPSVSSVGTGTQTVAYSPATPVGEFGNAMAMAAWHKEQSYYGGLVSVELTVSRTGYVPLTRDVWFVYEVPPRAQVAQNSDGFMRPVAP